VHLNWPDPLPQLPRLQPAPFSQPQLFLALPRRCPTPPAKLAGMKLKTENQFMQPVEMKVPKKRFQAQVHQAPQRPNLLPINDALQIKAAEYWLKLGEADQALKALEALPSKSWKSGWALKTRIAAMGVLRERDEMMAQA
jgi:hypothetical protein